MRRAGALLVGISACFLGIYFYLVSLDSHGPQVPSEPYVQKTQVVLATALPTITEPVQEPAMTESLTPEPTLVFDGYKLGGVDLDSGKPTAMIVTLPGGEKIVTTWASATGPTTDPEGKKFADAHNGSIFTIKAYDGTPVMLVHSGQISHKWVLFGSTLDWYVRHDELNNEIRLSEALAKVDALKNSEVVLCQLEDAKIEFPVWFDGNCEGVLLRLRISAAALILEDQVDQYSAAFDSEPLSWLSTSLYDPRGGMVSDAFWFVRKGGGFLLSTCVQRFVLDQADKAGVPDYEFNRLAVWFEVP